LKLFHKIGSIVLVIAFINVIASKSIHEFFEHKHELHSCFNKDSEHFHNLEFAHVDVICDYNFSTTFLNDYSFHSKSIIPYFQKQLISKYLWIIKNNYLNNLLLRGPPLIK